MPEFLSVLILAALPAFGNLIGGLLADIIHLTERSLSVALHFAAGVIFAVVGVELMPEILAGEPVWVTMLAFVAGGGVMVILDGLLQKVRNRLSGSGNTVPWMIFTGVAVDLFSDGILIGTSSTISLDLGLLVALGQVIADVPEGMATIATFKRREVPRKQRLLLVASFAIPVLLGATLGYWVMRGQPALLRLSVLALTAGMLLTVVNEQIVPEAHMGGEARYSALALVSGFGLFTLLAQYLG
ncbi:MAG: ZIP family metal transporter [Chloroflexi bacterium]|jgi:ZIP family zinc transporter|nr:ZIP family metal transporter [Chloroflexota bacterium]